MIDLSYIIPDMKTNTDDRTEERKKEQIQWRVCYAN